MNTHNTLGAGAMLAATLFAAAMPVQAETEHYGFLVSVQDTAGDHLCNGVYIGEQQIMLSPTCRGTEQGPLIEASASFSSMQPQANAPTPIPFPGYPSQVVYTLADGTSSESYGISSLRMHPLSGGNLVADVSGAPDGVEALPLATHDLIKKLEQAGDSQVTLVGRYLDSQSDKVVAQPYIMQPVADCFAASEDPLTRDLCLTQTLPGFCVQPIADAATGAPLVYAGGSQRVLVGISQKATGLFGCQRWAAASQYAGWVQWLRLQQQGLSLASAYDLGDQEYPDSLNFEVKVSNTSDQIFDLSNIELLKKQGFRLQNSDCKTLNPGQQCGIDIVGKPQSSIRYIDLLQLTVNGNTAGSYLAANYPARAIMPGDGGAWWRMSGWKPTQDSGTVLISANGEYSQGFSLSREKTLVNPGKVSITYRAPGTAQWHMLIGIERRGLFGDGVVLMPANTLPGTNNQWVTSEFAIDAPGTYKASVTTGFVLGNGAGTFKADIASICFDECAD